MIDALLTFLHLLAILSWTVFLTSQTALARAEWLNTAALTRLDRVSRAADAGALAVLGTGAARIIWGVKGWAWPLQQPLLWIKLVLFAAMALIGWQASRQIHAWHRAHRGGAALPAAAELQRVRQRLLHATHLMPGLLLLGVLLSRGLFAA